MTGVALTKLDGSAKGGVAIPIAYELGLPVKLVGVGEQLEDLRPFDAQDLRARLSYSGGISFSAYSTMLPGLTTSDVAVELDLHGLVGPRPSSPSCRARRSSAASHLVPVPLHRILTGLWRSRSPASVSSPCVPSLGLGCATLSRGACHDQLRGGDVPFALVQLDRLVRRPEAASASASLIVSAMPSRRTSGLVGEPQRLRPAGRAARRAARRRGACRRTRRGRARRPRFERTRPALPPRRAGPALENDARERRRHVPASGLAPASANRPRPRRSSRSAAPRSPARISIAAITSARPARRSGRASSS